VAPVIAVCDPPVGWVAQPLKSSINHKHQIWLSPTGDTAYGVIHFLMPLPLGNDTALWGFLQHMKISEGQANLISKTVESNPAAIRFVAEGGIYRIRAYLTTRGWEGWAAYAGTLRKKSENPAELDLAESARDHTTFGQPTAASSKVAGSNRAKTAGQKS
jgi:hypothetical protein